MFQTFTHIVDGAQSDPISPALTNQHHPTPYNTATNYRRQPGAATGKSGTGSVQALGGPTLPAKAAGGRRSRRNAIYF